MFLCVAGDRGGKCSRRGVALAGWPAGGCEGARPRARALLVTAPEISHVAANSPTGGGGAHSPFFPALVRLFTTVGGYRSAARI